MSYTIVATNINSTPFSMISLAALQLYYTGDQVQGIPATLSAKSRRATRLEGTKTVSTAWAMFLNWKHTQTLEVLALACADRCPTICQGYLPAAEADKGQHRRLGLCKTVKPVSCDEGLQTVPDSTVESACNRVQN